MADRAAILVAFHLDRRVVDAEAVVQFVRQLLQEAVAGVAPGHHEMRGEGHFGGAHRPNVKVMHFDYARQFG